VYAVIITGGKQYKVQEGDIIYVEKLGIEEGQPVVFDKVLTVNSDDGLKVGAPYVVGATVEAQVIRNAKAKKVVIFKYKAKKNEKKKMGHRQPYSKVQISKVSL